MKKTLSVLLLTFLFGNMYAQQPKEIIDIFFKTYNDIGFDRAVDDLFATNKWMANNKEATDNVKGQFSGLQLRIGEYYGYEPLTAQKTGTCYEYYTYLVKYERQPLRFHFAFYKAKNKWIFQVFKYEDQIAPNLEQSAIVNCIFDIEKD